MKKINVKGPIIPSNLQWIYDWLDMEATSPKKVISALEEANGEDVEVYINSGGGSVFDGSEIYTALKEHKGKVTAKVVGIAASAASVLAMGADILQMSPTSQMMIHNAATRADGDYRDMEHTAVVLKNANKTAANAYMAKTGMSETELLDMMDKETWMTAQQAMEYKMIDEIMFEQDVKVVASMDNSGLLPQQVIDKVRNELLKEKQLDNQSEESSTENDQEEDFYMHNLRKKKLELKMKEVI
ncbi:Clp protease ClpP [Virgibacillus halodenitrificans]|uniref:head maturation protease, ClpP-related n=1 Tax=Virgibacillus halodenitrificans TaxID=1482 RepID=UPI001F2B4B09|nr:head maturation protease, ClpP-related [Virgibacillus halodenitrificans]MCG1029305.1 Clp protease ClpP [Virgibacillus halodenitrificans]